MSQPTKEHKSSTATSPTVSIQPHDSSEDTKEQIPEEEPTEYPQGLKLALITLALCLSVFLMALDNTIIATAIPKITDHFQSLDDVGWYGSAYLLTTAGFQLLFGKFYTFLSIKWTYIVAISIFEIGSLVCGAAPSSNALIIGRAVAGIGSAGVFSGALIIIAHSVPLSKRPIYSGVIGAMYGLASVAGPLLGGVFTDKVTWRWCFYINLPIGGVTLGVIALFFRSPRRSKQITDWRDGLKKFDSWGTLVFIPAIVSLLLALQWGGTKYPWASARIIALFVVFGVLIIAFAGIQIWKQDDATVPPRILFQRSILASALFAFSLGASFFILVYFIPIWFQAIKGTSAVRSGIDNLPMILSVVVSSLISGAIISATGYYSPWMIISSVLASVGAGMISTFEPATSTGKWIGYQIIYGFGIGSGMQQPLMAAQTVLPLQDVPSGTAIIVFMQTVGGAIFISIAQNVFSNKLASGIAEHVPDLNPGVILGAGATSLKYVVPEQFLERVIQVYNDALVSAYYVSIAMACLTLVGALSVEWKNMKKSGNGPATMHAA
ncbi:major facilitator superfamily transporter [Moniliophthora roreri MCA 2997]|uniref:Major facilitator superfamily transporter n=1 Tax=Moniliophthora roreri (strain MCA 2997) TaxID=1381753 RepID=V2XRF8_MONRO|nr:major facilitator superfamily transporter [Moniliophthora roreri MCA 2997]